MEHEQGGEMREVQRPFPKGGCRGRAGAPEVALLPPISMGNDGKAGRTISGLFAKTGLRDTAGKMGDLERPSEAEARTHETLQFYGGRVQGTCIPHGERRADRPPGDGSENWLARSCPHTQDRRGGVDSYACAGGR